MRTVAITVRCDLCGYGGAFSRPEGFTRIGDVDLCQWCADEQPKRRMESGGHTVDIANGSWSCSCGEVYGSVVLRLRLHGVTLRVLDAVPRLVEATASAHLNGHA